MADATTVFGIPILTTSDPEDQEAFSGLFSGALEAILLKVGIRQFGSQAEMNAATADPGALASVVTIPGAYFVRVGSAWVMRGEGVFASSAARDAAITVPAVGMRVRRTDLNWSMEYADTTTSELGVTIPASWRPSAGQNIGIRKKKSATDAVYATPTTWIVLQNNVGWDPDTVFNNANTAVTWTGAGFWQAAIAGRYTVRFDLSGDIATGSGVLAVLQINNTTTISDAATIQENPVTAVAGRADLHLERTIVLAAGDTVTAFVYNTASWTISAARRNASGVSIQYLAPI